MDDERVCRVCRAGDEGGQLYRPCRCKGSIEYCHEDCLKSWLSISRGHRCELCKHPFRWEKVYASQAPSRLPSLTIARHVLLGLFASIRLVLRFILVATVWVGVLPYAILWAWRGFFHLGRTWGVAWTVIAKEADWSPMALASLFARQHNAAPAAESTAKHLASRTITDLAATNTVTLENRTVITVNRFVNGTLVSSSMRPKITSLEEVFRDFIDVWSNMGANVTAAAKSIAQPEASMSHLEAVDHQYIALKSLAQDLWRRHRDSLSVIASDCFTGQIIVCCVVVLFVAAFLLREWVVANQPQPQDAAAAPPMAQAAMLPPAPPPQAPVHAEDLDMPPLEQLQIAELHDQTNSESAPRVFRGYEGDDTPEDNQQDGQALPSGSPGQDNLFSFVLPEPLTPTANKEAAESDEASRSWQSSDESRSALPVTSPSGTPNDMRTNPEPMSDAARAFLQRRRELRDSDSAGTETEPEVGQAREQQQQQQQRGGEESQSSNNTVVVDVTATPNTQTDINPEASDTPVIGPAPRPDNYVDPPAAPPRREDDDDSDFSDDDDDRANPLRNRNRQAAGIAAADLAAIEAAENEEDMLIEADLQGIMEAVGIQGPIVALVQNAALMALLITCLLATIVWAPLMLGKTFVATNTFQLFFVPVNLVRYFTDPIADYSIGLVAQARSRYISQKAPVPELPPPSIFVRLVAMSKAVVGRMRKQPALVEDLSYAQVLKGKARYLLSYYRDTGADRYRLARQITQARWQSMAIHDDDIDRVLCIALGYAVLLVVAVLYLRHTQNIQARNATRAVREALSQQFVLAKAAGFFIVEILAFPTVCGVLMNLATLPLLPGATIASRIAYHVYAPITSGFLSWLFGTLFMHAFAQAIGVIRKCLRKGVLWFIRDPSDPETNPLREILETPAFNQAKKISRSMLVYGAIVLTCFGTFPWLTSLLNIGIFPLRWDMTRPISSVPVDLLFVLLVLPRTLGRVRTRRTLRKLLSQWCVVTAHQLRLSSFLLGARRPEEEGTLLHKTWKDWLFCRTEASAHHPVPGAPKTSEGTNFRRDGAFARVVAADNVKIVPRAMFLRCNEDGSPLNDEGARIISSQLSKGPNDESKFTVVYIPPHFKSRILLFIYLLWFTGSMAIFSVLSAPLVLGRIVLDLFFDRPLHDTYSLVIGLHMLLAASKLHDLVRWRMTVHAPSPISITTTANTSGTALIRTKTLWGRVLLVINAGIVLPLLVGAVFHLYVLAAFDTGKERFPTLSLSMCWCYGVLACHLACSVAAMFPPNLLTSTAYVSEQNKRVAIMNLRLSTALLLPSLVTSVYYQLGKILWIARGTGSALVSAPHRLVYRAAVFSNACISAGLLLAKPVKKLASKWLAAVWEREYVIQKKLRNIDDPPASTDTQETPIVGDN